MSNSIKEEIKIRPYESKDKDAVINICAVTGSNNEKMQRLIYLTFCKYYIEREPQNCFVAANSRDEAIGYIICAENAAEWGGVFKKEYIDRQEDENTRRFMEATTEGPLSYSAQYPAHLHIDILPEYQRMGVGTALMDRLVSHLKNKGIGGLVLFVASDNEKGISFYNKYGFKVLNRHENATAMGLKINPA